MNWRCHTVLRFRSVPSPSFHMFRQATLGSGWCPGVFSSGLSVDSYDTQRSNNHQKRPDHQTLVAMSLSESTWARTCQQERRHLEYACAKNSCHMLCTMPPKICRETFVAPLWWHCTKPWNSWKFSPSKVSHYTVLSWIIISWHKYNIMLLGVMSYCMGCWITTMKKLGGGISANHVSALTSTLDRMYTQAQEPHL